MSTYGPDEPTRPIRPGGGSDRPLDPTQAIPPEGSEPTRVMPAGGGGGGGQPPDQPPPGAGFPGDDEYGEEPHEQVPWYREPGPVAAMVAGLAALVMVIIAIVVLAGDDGDDELETLPTASSTTTTLPSTTTSPPTTLPPTTVATTTAPTTTVPPTTPSPTTQPPTTTTTTTTTLPPTTTTSTTTTTTTTLPPTLPPTTAPPTLPPDPTVWDNVRVSPELSDLRRFAERTGLRDIFADEDRELTLLAPNNAAFDRLAASPGGPDLLADDEAMREVLERHIIEEELSRDDIFARDTLVTLHGDELSVDAERETIEGASILTADIEAVNGPTHVVDLVLVP